MFTDPATLIAAGASVVALISAGLNVHASARLRNVSLAAKLDVANLENSLVARINGTYVRHPELVATEKRCEVAHQSLGVALKDLHDYLERQDARLSALHDDFIEHRAAGHERARYASGGAGPAGS